MSYSEIEKIILQDDTRGMATLYENIEKGFIERSKRGRIVTKIGWNHLGLEPTKQNNDQINFLEK